jgi:hypothetical protein
MSKSKTTSRVAGMIIEALRLPGTIVASTAVAVAREEKMRAVGTTGTIMTPQIPEKKVPGTTGVMGIIFHLLVTAANKATALVVHLVETIALCIRGGLDLGLLRAVAMLGRIGAAETTGLIKKIALCIRGGLDLGLLRAVAMLGRIGVAETTGLIKTIALYIRDDLDLLMGTVGTAASPKICREERCRHERQRTIARAQWVRNKPRESRRSDCSVSCSILMYPCHVVFISSRWEDWGLDASCGD